MLTNTANNRQNVTLKCSFIHLFNKKLLITWHVPVSFGDTLNTEVNKTDKNLSSQGFYILRVGRRQLIK